MEARWGTEPAEGRDGPATEAQEGKSVSGQARGKVKSLLYRLK